MEQQRKVSLGIINIMPDTDTYHRELAQAFSCVAGAVDLHWLRLESKTYSPEAQPFVMREYRSFASVAASVQLDGLVVSGAPLELMDFAAVSYWDELQGILRDAIAGGQSTFGICWGALAIGKVLGLRKTVLDTKVSGVFALANVAGRASAVACLPDTLHLPFSIQAQLDAADVQQQVHEGKLEVAGTVASLPHAFVHTCDNKHFLCLGHPEYGAHRLVAEWHRDRKKDPATPPPQGVDLALPQAHWRPVADQLFTSWVQAIAAGRPRWQRTERASGLAVN